MRHTPWLRIFACGVAVGFGGLLDASPVGAVDDPPKTANSSATTDLPGSEAAFAKVLFGNLSAEHLKSLGEMLEKDWKDRPEWGDMAVAILKDDFMRPGAGWWKPSAQRYDWGWLSERLDANKDGQVERDEFPKEIAQADLLFERLDRDSDSVLTPTDFDGSDANPAVGQMSNRLFDKLDQDSNGRVTPQELTEFFRRADKDQSGFLTPDDLRLAIADLPSKKRTGREADAPAIGPSTPTAALRMLLNGELGWLNSGPQLGDLAPDFTLPKHDGSGDIKLSNSFGTRPVVLVFGSFT